MIAGTILLEDNTIHFREVKGQMEITVSDNMSGRSNTMYCSFEQAGAIIGTSVCGTNEEVLTVCEPLVKATSMAQWPPELQSSPVAS